MSDMINVKDLTYTYNVGMPYATTAIENINFTVKKGEFIGIIGPTGCGKSTLITHFNGLNKPTGGNVIIDGEDIWENPKNIRKFRFLCGLVFQYPEYQLFEDTAYKDIAFGPINMQLSQGEVEERVMQAAQFCGIDDEILNKSPFELSGGQKRRVAIAGVLAMRPRLLVLDEPAAGLDPKGRDDILGKIRAYHDSEDTTTILVSHSMEDIAKYADKVLVLNAGKVAMFDTTENIFARANELMEMGLSVPEVTKIFLGLKARGIDIRTDVYTLPYAVKTILATKNAQNSAKGGA